MPKGPTNTPKLKIHNNYFQGGTTIDPKLGVANSFFYSQNLDFRTKPSQMSVLPAPAQLTTELDDLILAMDQDTSGVRYGAGNNGRVYKIDNNNVFTVIGELDTNGSAGILYNQVTDNVYIPSQQTVSLYNKVTSSHPVFRGALFAQSASNMPGCTNLYNPDDGFYDGIARNTAGNSYTLPTTISERSNDYCYFAPDIEPFYSIKVFVINKGTGNWTLTLHDSLNNVLEAVTISNGTLNNNQYNEFKFTTSGGIRALVNASQTGNSPTYHYHLTSTVADGTCQVVTSGDLSSADFLLNAYRLVATNNGWHPTALFTGSGKPLLCVGNGPYLSTYDFSNDSNPTNQQWVRHALTFRSGYEVCGLTINNQYLIIACERRSTNANRKFQAGILYFWDGSQAAPNFSIDIPMGAPYGIHTFNNVTYFACAGSLFAWSGGQTVIKVRKLAYQNTDYLGTADNTLVNPNMFTSRYNLLLMGYPSKTTNVNLNFGIWTWGTVELTFPNSYGLSYTLSNKQLNFSNSNQLQIGCVYNFVDNLYMSWQYTDGSGQIHYGMDYLDNSSTPATYAEWQSLIWDGGAVYKQKNALRLKVKFLSLPSGFTLKPKYSINRGAWQYGPDTAQPGDTNIVVEFNNSRFHELQWGFELYNDGTATQPAIVTGVTAEIDPRSEEVDVRKDV